MTNAQNGLGYSPNGNILVGNDSANGNWAYTYDDFNRIGSALCGSGAAACPGAQTALGYSYSFDRYGNRWHQTVTAGSATMSNLSFDANNHIIPTGNCTSTFTYCIDASGNLLNDGSHSYTYDAENRMTKVDTGTTASYAYDAKGRRVSKVSSAGTVDYFYDVLGRQSVVTNPSGAAIRAEIYAARRHVGTYTNSTTFFSFTDWLGTERVRAGVNGATVETCEGAPYGDMQYCTNTDQSPLHFTGDERDPETGLDHTDFRQYSSFTGRWMTPDPAGLAAVDVTNPQSWNRYPYALNNPEFLIDPSGLCGVVYDAKRHRKRNYFAGRGRLLPLDELETDLAFQDPDPVDCPADGGAGSGDDPPLTSGGGTEGICSGMVGSGTSGCANNPTAPPADQGPDLGNDDGNFPIAIAGVGYPSGLGCTGAPPSRLGSASPSKIYSGAVTTSIPTKAAGALIGGALGGPPGAAIGGIIGSTLGVGINVSFVPSTQNWYVGPTAVFSPVTGGSSVNLNYVNVPSNQNPNSIASGGSYSLTYQFNSIAGATIIKSPGSRPVAGPSIGTRADVAVGASFNICITSCGGC
jgi:RHS repeat-associated protein